MKENKHLEKELLFKNNIKEITSIALDSEHKIKNNIIEGNFIINGEYKIHEVSINKEKFNFKIPFKFDLEKDIEPETVKLEITNFIYDYKKDELIVNIDYTIEGERKNILLFDDEESLDEFLKKREVEVIDTRLDEIKDKINSEEKTINNNETNIDENRKSIDKIEEKYLEPEKKENINEINDERNIISVEETSKEDRNNIDSNELINNIDKTKDSFITYKIYKIKENETLESLVIKNKTTIEDLSEYNDLKEIKMGDKLIIPNYE